MVCHTSVKDGERNPEINGIADHTNMDRMASDSQSLALAWYFTHDERYAARAALLLRAWFLDPATRMNPNLNFGQYIPGINEGRGIGIIETRGLTSAVDAVGLLAGAPAWSDADRKGMELWFSEFTKWLQESANGKDEAKAANNHGTFYDLQVADFLLFTHQDGPAKEFLSASRAKRIAAQIEPDGRQPLETDRTRGISYRRDEFERSDFAGNPGGACRRGLLGFSDPGQPRHRKGARLARVLFHRGEKMAVRPDRTVSSGRSRAGPPAGCDTLSGCQLPRQSRSCGYRPRCPRTDC
ncbi:MAG: alginate lyase family protein [Ignavibacteriota bacterium]